MNKNFILIILSLFLLINGSFAQKIPKKSDIKFVVNTETITATEKPQTISLTILNESSEIPQSLIIYSNDFKSVWTLFDAYLNGEKLWLIKADSASQNTSVLAWNYDKNTSRLVLYPSNLGPSFSLEIDVQINIKNFSSLKNNSATHVNMIAELPGGTFEASVMGRGNEINLR